MTSWDYFVGFEREPEDLDAFLKNQGYDLFDTDQDNVRNYVSMGGELADLVDLSYSPEVIEGDEVDEGEPDWSESGRNIISQLEISTKESVAADEALRITEETAKRYNSISYDPGLGFF